MGVQVSLQSELVEHDWSLAKLGEKGVQLGSNSGGTSSEMVRSSEETEEGCGKI